MNDLLLNAQSYLTRFCVDISNRSVGSKGNQIATTLFSEIISKFGFKIENQHFDCIDFVDNGSQLTANGESFEVFTSPYSLGGVYEDDLWVVQTVEELRKINKKNKILLLINDIAKEPLMPKNFVFYNPDEHKEIISLLENLNPKAIICATSQNFALSGGVYPFPTFEDGDFNIPSVYMKDIYGTGLLKYEGQKVKLIIDSKRINSTGNNIIASKNENFDKKIVITAHIDSKKGTNGAIDNGSGIVVLLLIAQLLKDFTGKKIEIVPFNGEDYYAVSGEMIYIAEKSHDFKNILLNINIDGVGLKGLESAYSFYNCENNILNTAKEVFSQYDGVIEGEQFYQGDHSIFVQYNIPAIAIISSDFNKVLSIAHTKDDTADKVDLQKIVQISKALAEFVEKI